MRTFNKSFHVLILKHESIIPLERWILGVPESTQLLDEKVEDGLDLFSGFIWSLRSKNSKNVCHTTGNQQLDVSEMVKITS